MSLLVAVYKPLVIGPFNSIWTQVVKKKKKHVSKRLATWQMCMLLRNVITRLSNSFCLGVGNAFPRAKSIFQLRQQVGYKVLGFISENENQTN